MKRYIFRLQFTAPVHFGAAEHGGKLEQIALAYSSDTLFSAICCELAEQGMYEALETLAGLNEDGHVVFSDLFPCCEQDGETQFFLPKPIMQIERDTESAVEALSVIRQQSTARKKLKKLAFLRASHMGTYLKAMRTGQPFQETAEFGRSSLMVRVNQRGREPMPYYVASFSFQEGAGMYLIARTETQQQADDLAEILKSLGMSGIGGKRSSGYGKFVLVNGAEPVEEFAGSDAEALQDMLQDDNAPWQMSLSSLLPGEEQLGELTRAQYKLRQRSGFVMPEQAGTAQKKDSIYMLASGSCLPVRIPGNMAVLGTYQGHDILRSGVSLYAGLRW